VAKVIISTQMTVDGVIEPTDWFSLREPLEWNATLLEGDLVESVQTEAATRREPNLLRLRGPGVPLGRAGSRR
jgi:hypothetical protein